MKGRGRGGEESVLRGRGVEDSEPCTGILRNRATGGLSFTCSLGGPKKSSGATF